MRNFFKIIFGNFTYKVIAALLGIIFWYIVQSEQTLEINRKVRVQLIPPEGFVFKNGNILFKDALLRGPRALLSHFPLEPIVAQLRIFADKPQNIKTRVDREHIKGWNDRIKITIYDASISAFLDRKIEKEILIKQNLLGVPKEGYVVEKTIILPEKISISGSESELQRLDYLLTEPVDVNGLSANKTFESSLQLNDLVIKTNSKKVQVNVILSEKKIHKTIPNITVDLEGPYRNVKITPNKLSVILEAGPKDFEQLKNSDIKVYLSTNDLNTSTHEYKVQVKLPHNFVLIDTFPSKVVVEFINKKRGL